MPSILDMDWTHPNMGSSGIPIFKSINRDPRIRGKVKQDHSGGRTNGSNHRQDSSGMTTPAVTSSLTSPVTSSGSTSGVVSGITTPTGDGSQIIRLKRVKKKRPAPTPPVHHNAGIKSNSSDLSLRKKHIGRISSKQVWELYKRKKNHRKAPPPPVPPRNKRNNISLNQPLPTEIVRTELEDFHNSTLAHFENNWGILENTLSINSYDSSPPPKQSIEFPSISNTIEAMVHREASPLRLGEFQDTETAVAEEILDTPARPPSPLFPPPPLTPSPPPTGPSSQSPLMSSSVYVSSTKQPAPPPPNPVTLLKKGSPPQTMQKQHAPSPTLAQSVSPTSPPPVPSLPTSVPQLVQSIPPPPPPLPPPVPSLPTSVPSLVQSVPPPPPPLPPPPIILQVTKSPTGTTLKDELKQLRRTNNIEHDIGIPQIVIQAPTPTIANNIPKIVIHAPTPDINTVSKKDTSVTQSPLKIELKDELLRAVQLRAWRLSSENQSGFVGTDEGSDVVFTEDQETSGSTSTLKSSRKSVTFDDEVDMFSEPSSPDVVECSTYLGLNLHPDPTECTPSDATQLSKRSKIPCSTHNSVNSFPSPLTRSLKHELLAAAAQKAAARQRKQTPDFHQKFADDIKKAFQEREIRRNLGALSLRPFNRSYYYEGCHVSTDENQNVAPGSTNKSIQQLDSSEVLLKNMSKVEKKSAMESNIKSESAGNNKAWVPAQDLPQDVFDDEITTHTSRATDYYQLSPPDAKPDSALFISNNIRPTISPKAKSTKLKRIQRSMRNAFGSLRKNFGSRESLRDLHKDGWEIFPTSHYDAPPNNPVKISHIEHSSAYAFHSGKQELHLIPNFDKVLVTEDGQRIRERTLSFRKSERHSLHNEQEKQDTLASADNPIRLGHVITTNDPLKSKSEQELKIDKERQKLNDAETPFKVIQQMNSNFKADGNGPSGGEPTSPVWQLVTSPLDTNNPYATIRSTASGWSDTYTRSPQKRRTRSRTTSIRLLQTDESDDPDADQPYSNTFQILWRGRGDPTPNGMRVANGSGSQYSNKTTPITHCVPSQGHRENVKAPDHNLDNTQLNTRM